MAYVLSPRVISGVCEELISIWLLFVELVGALPGLKLVPASVHESLIRLRNHLRLNLNARQCKKRYQPMFSTDCEK